MTPQEASHQIDRAITQAIGALMAARREGDDMAKVIADLASARLSAMQLACIAVGGGKAEPEQD